MLGLSIAKEIVEAHGGRIAAQSEAGREDHFPPGVAGHCNGPPSHPVDPDVIMEKGYLCA